jgi:glycerol-3-phosphate dehydrogenase (NAD(P)+)
MLGESCRVGVLGGGSWGTALAHLLAERGHEVTLWAFEPEVVEGINQDHLNPLYLSGVPLSARLLATGDVEEALRDAALVLSVIPSQHVRGQLRAARDLFQPDVPIVICSKGIERGTLATLDRVFAEELPAHCQRSLAVLSGPSFALEVARNMPSNVTVAARDLKVARRVQGLVSTRAFRAYTTDDVVGVEIGGALKNVIAIAVGVSDGLGFGSNTRAALMTRGLAEVTRLAVAMGGQPETMLGLAGMGDLVLTCTGELSRNRQVGKLLGEGKTLAAIERDMRMIAEGVPTAESAYALAQKRGVDCPITEQVYKVLYEGITVVEGMSALQDRRLKDEWGER